MNKKNFGWLIACLLLVTAAVVPITSNFFTSPNYTGTTASTARTYLGLGSIATNAEGRFLTVTNPAQVVGTFRVGTASTVNTTISSNGTVIGTGSVFDFYTGSRAFIGQPTNATEVPLHVVKRNDQATNMVELETVGGVVLAGANSNGVWFGDGSLLTGVIDSTALHQSSNLGDVQSVSASRANLGLGTMALESTNGYIASSAGNGTNTLFTGAITATNANVVMSQNNLFTGPGTVSAANAGFLWTNSGANFKAENWANFIVVNVSHQFSIAEIVSSTVIRTYTPADANYTNVTWKYYSNYFTFYDAAGTVVAAIDGGGGYHVKSFEISNDGAFYLGSGVYSLRQYGTTDYGGFGPMVLHQTTLNTVPYFFSINAPNSTLGTFTNGFTSVRGLTNVAGPTIPFGTQPQFNTGSPGAGKVLTSTDSSGSAVWSNAPSGSGLSSLTVPAYLSTNGSLTDPVIAGNGTTATFASVLATNGVIDNGPTTNTLLAIVNVAGGRVLTNIASVADGQTIVRDQATAGGWKATNWPASGSGTVTSVALDFSPGWLTVTGSPVTTSGTLTLSGNGNTATLDSLITTNDVQARGFIAPNSGGFVEINQSFLKSGSDSPEGVVTLTTGSLYLMDTTNGLPWAKTTSGSGNTGWQQLQSANTVTDIVNAITLPATNFLAATNGAGTNLLITNMTVAGYMRPVLATAVFASSTNYVVDFNLSDYENATLTADVNFQQSTNRSSTLGGKKVLTLYPNGTNRTVTLSAGGAASWHTNGFYSTSFTLTNNTYATITFYCNGSTETNVFSKYQIWP